MKKSVQKLTKRVEILKKKRSPRLRLAQKAKKKKLTIIERESSSSERKLRSPEPSSSCRNKH